jgi:hypothetical protein
MIVTYVRERNRDWTDAEVTSAVEKLSWHRVARFFLVQTYQTGKIWQIMYYKPPWRRSIVVIAYAYRTEEPGFESRQGVRFF